MNLRKTYYYLFVLYSIVGVWIAIYKNINDNAPFGVFFKSYFIIILIIAILSIIENKLRIFFETKLFLVFFLIPFIYGLIKFGFRSELLLHIYAVITPIFATSFGYHLSYNYKSDKMEVPFVRLMTLCYYSNIFLIILFQAFIRLGLVIYPAVAPTGLLFSSIFFLSRGKWLKFFIGLVFIVLSGKRSPFVVVIAVFLLFIIDILRSSNFTKQVKKKVQRGILLIGSFGVGATIFFWTQTNFLNRFKLIFQFDLSDEYAMYIATGGRSQEIINILKYLNQNPIEYFIGAGFGVRVEVMENFYRHYSHLSPLSYVLLFGMFFAMIIYLSFTIKLLKPVNISDELYFTKLFFAAFFVTSFFGAIVLSDANFWVFYGMFLGYLSKRT